VISVIIPTLNEAKALPATLDSVFAQPGRFETILVDGGSTDDTLAIAASYPRVRVCASRRGRAEQMNAGAEVAGGEFLLFLHADTHLPPRAIAELNRLEADPDCQAGGFHHAFSGRHWTLRFVSWLHNRRCAWTGIFYGDQAMFVRRALFEDVGGFSPGALEDIVLSERLLERCEPRFLASPVVTDSRKFERMGPLRSFGRCLLILLCYQLRLPLAGRAFFAPIR
jgi:rSAM/selenodomain-associated transferase 2